MDSIKNFLTRKEVRERTGWSFNFIDKRLPRTRIGGKVLIPIAGLELLLKGGQSDA